MNENKPVVERFVQNLLMDRYPQTLAEIVDFGFNYAQGQEQALYAAYRNGIIRSHFTVDDLMEAVGNGEALTKLVQKSNPALSVVTDYDFFHADVDFFEDDDSDDQGDSDKIA